MAGLAIDGHGQGEEDEFNRYPLASRFTRYSMRIYAIRLSRKVGPDIDARTVSASWGC